jgi:hypothetical protein
VEEEELTTKAQRHKGEKRKSTKKKNILRELITVHFNK